jgi:tetratricopeptide (TPR) repeat protein
VDGLHQRLGNRLSLLRGRSQGVPSRQRTLRATLDWSHELLNPNERAVLRRLAVFAGSFQLDAAQQAAASAELDVEAVLDALEGLVDKSLVKLEQLEPPRYRMAETTRLYAREQLVESGEVDEARRGHAAYAAAFLEDCYRAWLTIPELLWRSRIEAELDDIRAGLQWSVEQGADVTATIAMVSAALPVWLYRDAAFRAEGLRYVRHALTLLDLGAPGRLEARLWFAFALLLPYDQPGEKIEALAHAVRISRAAGVRQHLCHALVEQARVLLRLGRCDDANTALDEAESAIEKTSPSRLRGFYFMARASLKQSTGDLMGASALHGLAADLLAGCGADALAICAANNLADALWAQGDLDEAINAFSRTVDLARKYPLSDADSIGVPLGNWAAALFEQGKVDEGTALVREALTLLRRVGKGWELCDALAVRLLLIGRYQDAARVQGFVDHVYEDSSETRQPNEKRLREMVFDKLRNVFDDKLMEQLHGAGALLSEQDVLGIAL